MPESHIIAWDAGTWTNDPQTVTETDALEVTAIEGSDAWRHTAYGFVHDTEHALLAPLAVGEAMEVSFRAPWDGQFDQAGVFVRIDAEHWMKAGVEYADDHLGLGAVVTMRRLGLVGGTCGRVARERDHGAREPVDGCRDRPR